MRILLVEDDTLLGEALRSGLRQSGFATDWVCDGHAADAALASESFSAVVLDLGLPGMDGMALLRRLRARGDTTPVLVLTARDALDDRVDGLDAGADDYVAKPVAIAELAARLRALVRRASGVASSRVRVGDITLDSALWKVTSGGQYVDLSPREFAVLQALMLAAGRVLTREQLEAALYEWDRSLASNAIEVHVHYLRKKLGTEAIRTVRGVGYVMQGAVEDA